MCEKCDNEDNDKTRKLYDRWLKEQGIETGNLVGSDSETGMIRLPDVGILFLQTSTDRSKVTEDGITPMPDSPVAGIIIHEDQIMDFISGVFYQMGPEFMFNMLRRDVSGDPNDN